MPSMRLRRTLALAAIVLFAAAASAEAGPPGKWTQVTGIGEEDGNTMRPGLARTADAVLHVLWTRDVAGAGSVLHSAVSADAKTVSGPVSVLENADGVNPGSALVVAPDGGLRAFFAATNVFDGLLATATSPDGNAWTVQGPASKLKPEGKPVYVAGGIGAATGLDGAFYSIWGDSSPAGAGYHVGLDPNLPDGELPNAALESDPKLAVDSASGQVVSAWNEIDGNGNVVVMPLSPAAGPTPIGGSTSQSLHPVGITGRIGAPGVFVAYLRGTNPFLSDPSLYRVDTGKAIRVTRKDGELVSIAAAPGGRLWMFWKTDGGLRYTRSNKTATKFGRIVALNPPRKPSTVYDVAGEASRGPLDLLIHADPDSGPLASWHQRVLPGLDLTASQGKKGKTVVKVTDAGAPVSGAKVKVKGQGSKTTGGSGKVAFTLAAGKYKLSVSKKGYASYTKQVRLK